MWPVWHKASGSQRVEGPHGIDIHLQAMCFFVSLIRVNLSNIRLRTAFKLGGHGDGPHLACMNYVGGRSGNYDCFYWKQAMFGKRIPNKYC